eukprot:8810053-Pyramimonas_sp.AAC.1
MFQRASQPERVFQKPTEHWTVEASDSVFTPPVKRLRKSIQSIDSHLIQRVCIDWFTFSLGSLGQHRMHYLFQPVQADGLKEMLLAGSDGPP